MEVHIVQKGDTLWKIARQHGVSFEELKRVNAHLANPDYIVPGMKIMLPKKQGGTNKPQTPNHGGGAPPVNKQEKQPAKKPTPQKPSEQKPKPKPPVPPAPPVQPTPPPAQPMPPLPEMPQMPQMPQVPPMPPTQQMPMLPQMPMHCVQAIPMIGIPCGCWMPLHDANCHPHHHHMPMPPNQAPVEESCSVPAPAPPAPQMPGIDTEQEESPLYPSHGPIPIPDKWKPMESPMHLESPEMPGPMPPQNIWGPCHPGFPMNTQPMPCSSGQQYPVIPPPSPNHCNMCHQPMPMHMMPHQGQQWPGNY